MDIHEARIEGRMFNFIKNFLKLTSFRIKINVILSDTTVQTDDIQQGSVGSPNFFILKINKNVNKLANDNRFHKSL